jgi:hypothetical protein
MFPITNISHLTNRNEITPVNSYQTASGPAATQTDELHSFERVIASVSPPDIPPPEINNTNQGLGWEQVVQPQWTLNQTFMGEDQDDDIEVDIEKGFIYRETIDFPYFGRPDYFDIIWGEDWPPASSLYFYSLSTGETAFISFNATWQTPIILQGVWLNFWDAARGPISLMIFSAEYNATSGFNTVPNLADKIFSASFDFGPTPPGVEWWEFFDFSGANVILDPGMTYGNMFYLAITAEPSSKIDLNLCEDSDPVDPDNEDEADVWIGTTSPPSITFIPWDFYLDVEVNRFPYPSEINMLVNTTIVQNIWDYPGTGFADSGYYSPTNVTDSTRYYNITSTEASLDFDAFWKAWFLEQIWVRPPFVTYANETYVDWNITAYFDFPDRAFNKVIYISIEKGWTIIDVLKDGVSHGSWSRVPSSPDDWVQILDVDDAEWTVLCQSFNHVVDVDVLDEALNPVTDINATDFVFVRGYLEEQDGRPVSTGRGYLDVYDANEVLNYTTEAWASTGYVDLDWGIYWSVQICETPDLYTLQVIWANGTAAGMNSTTITIHPMSRLYILDGTTEPGSELIKGVDYQIVVYYCDHDWTGLDNATLSVRNDTSMASWHTWEYVNLKEVYENETYAGYYVIWAHTNDSAINVLHNITLTIVEGTYPQQQYSTNFIVIDAPQLIVRFLRNHGTIWDPIGMQWRTSPDPYINQTGLEFTIQVVYGLNHTPISGVNLHPILGWMGRNRYLIWEDLYQFGGKLGHYNITIDMTPIEGLSFHVGDVPVIQIFADEPGYKPGASELLHVQPRARPSFIDIPTPPHPLYAGWNYTYPLRVVLRDGLSGEDVSHGNVTAEIPGIGNVSLELATPGLGLYEITSLDTSPLQPGDYTVVVYAEATDYVSSINTVTLTILAKQTIDYTPVEVQIPSSYYGIMTLRVQFYFSSGSLITRNDVSANGLPERDSNKQGVSYLPEGTKVVLETHGLVGNPPTVTQYLDAQGWVIFEVEVNHDDFYSFYVSIDGSETFEGVEGLHLMLSDGNSSVGIRHPFTDLYIRSPWIAMGFVAVAGVVLGVRQWYFIPKRRQRLQKYQVIADTFSDVANLNRLLVLHKESGICVFDPFSEEGQEASLVAGFLQAISTFGHDLVDSPGMADNDNEEATTLRELTYEGFRILIHDGEFVRNALVLSGSPSDQLRERLERFTKSFEQRYHADFEQWDGRVDHFNSATDLVEEIFLISLRHPHRVMPEKPRGVSLTSMESDLYKLAKELTKDREYIFLGQILSTYLAAAKRNKLEVLMAIYQLRQKGVFKPWQIEDAIVAVAQRSTDDT